MILDGEWRYDRRKCLCFALNEGVYMTYISKLLVLFSIFPGWIDVVFIAFLVVVQKSFFLEGIELVVAILVTGFVRYLFLISQIGLMNFSSRNWYINEILLFIVAISLTFLFEQKTFTWLFSTYFAELTFFQLAVSAYKGVFKK